MPSHPVIFAGTRDGKLVCPACGHDRSRSIGVRRTRVAETQRRSCGKCGHVFNGKRVKLLRTVETPSVIPAGAKWRPVGAVKP